MKTKICSNPKCKQPKKPLSEFHKNKSRKDGRSCYCRICIHILCEINKVKIAKYNKKRYIKNKIHHAKKNKEWRIKNKTKISEKGKKDYIKNKEKISKRNKKRYEKNKVKILKQTKKYKDKNKEKISKRNKQYCDKNKVKISKYGKKWHKNNKEKLKKQRKNRKKTDIRFKIKENLRVRLNLALHGKDKTLSTMFLIGCEIDYLMYYLQEKFTEGMSWDNYGVHGWHIDHIKPCALFDFSKPSNQRKCFHWSNLQPLWAIDNLRKGQYYDQ